MFVVCSISSNNTILTSSSDVWGPAAGLVTCHLEKKPDNSAVGFGRQVSVLAQYSLSKAKRLSGGGEVVDFMEV